MLLEEQLQILIDQGASYDVPPNIISGAFVPVLRNYALSLPQEQYYIATNQSGDWLITVLESKSNPGQLKKVIFALEKSKGICKLLPVTHLLFEVFGRAEIDSVVFVDCQREISRANLVQDIDSSIKQYLIQSSYC
jgi:hypothetical protein